MCIRDSIIPHFQYIFLSCFLRLSHFILTQHFYYLGENDAIRTGWQEIDGKQYYFYDNGQTASDCFIDGRYLTYRGVYWTDEAREQETLRLVNVERESRGFFPVTIDPMLTKMVSARAEDLAAGDVFSHETPDHVTSKPTTRWVSTQ